MSVAVAVRDVSTVGREVLAHVVGHGAERDQHKFKVMWTWNKKPALNIYAVLPERAAKLFVTH